jgi:hypothetical protein
MAGRARRRDSGRGKERQEAVRQSGSQAGRLGCCFDLTTCLQVRDGATTTGGWRTWITARYIAMRRNAISELFYGQEEFENVEYAKSCCVTYCGCPAHEMSKKREGKCEGINTGE